MGRRKRLVKTFAGSNYKLEKVTTSPGGKRFNNGPSVGVRGFVPFVDDVSLDEIKDYLGIQATSVTLPTQVASVFGSFASNNFGDEYFFFNMKDVLGPDVDSWDMFGNVDQLLLRMTALYDRIQTKKHGKKQTTTVHQFVEKIQKEDIVYA